MYGVSRCGYCGIGGTGFGGVGHRAALFDRQRHRLLDDRVLAVAGRGKYVRGVMLMRGSDVYGVDGGILGDLIEIFVVVDGI